jgi:hypothetical protein
VGWGRGSGAYILHMICLYFMIMVTLMTCMKFQYDVMSSGMILIPRFVKYINYFKCGLRRLSPGCDVRDSHFRRLRKAGQTEMSVKIFIAVSFVEVFFPWRERLYYLRLSQTRYLAESTLHVL